MLFGEVKVNSSVAQLNLLFMFFRCVVYVLGTPQTELPAAPVIFDLIHHYCIFNMTIINLRERERMHFSFHIGVSFQVQPVGREDGQEDSLPHIHDCTIFTGTNSGYVVGHWHKPGDRSSNA